MARTIKVKKTKKRNNTETILKNNIIDWCIENKFLVIMVNSGRSRGVSWNKWWHESVEEDIVDNSSSRKNFFSKLINNKKIKSNTSGVSDLIVVDLLNSRTVYVELKSGEQKDSLKKLSPSQKIFKNILVSNNIPYIITTTLDDFINQITIVK